ncbi:MAG: hypothetical protein HDS26_00715 [Bacteroides sp.]|nr:hypothetical protein [Bacteroides sp.]
MKKLYALLSAMALTSAGTMSAITGSPFVEEPGEGTQSVWSRSSMCVTSMAGLFESIDPDYGGALTMVTADDGTVWVDYILSGFGVNGWTTGQIEGDKMTFNLPQEIYREDGKPYYLAVCTYNPLTEDYTMLQQDTEVVFTKIGNTWKSENLESRSRFIGLVSQDGIFMGTGDYDIDFTAFEAPALPSDSEVKYEPYNLIYGQYGNYCELGWGENGQVFLKGVLADAPDTYIMGSYTSDSLSIEAGQYLGVTSLNLMTPHHAFFMPVKDEGDEFVGLSEINFDINESDGVISSNGIYVINYTDDPENLFYTTICRNPKFTRQEVGATLIPANPVSVSFNKGDGSLLADIPLLSTTGSLLDADDLYYIVYVDGAPFTFFKDEYKYLDMEEMTEVPYNYTEDYDFMINKTYHVIYFYSVGIETIGIQSVYYGEGGPTYSDIVNSDGTITPAATNSVSELMGVSEGNAIFYDLQGRPVSSEAKGLLIKRIQNADGILRAVKVMR